MQSLSDAERRSLVRYFVLRAPALALPDPEQMVVDEVTRAIEAFQVQGATEFITGPTYLHSVIARDAVADRHSDLTDILLDLDEVILRAWSADADALECIAANAIALTWDRERPKAWTSWPKHMKRSEWPMCGRGLIRITRLLGEA